MKVLLVCNNIYGRGNGLAASARTMARYLADAGVEVRVLSQKSSLPDDPVPYYCLRKFNFPIFQKLIESQSYCFAVADRKIIRKALEWADVVHLEEAFPLQWITVNMALRMGVPCVSTFHMYPENISCSLGMGRFRLINAILLKCFQKTVYDKCSHIQCPTQNVFDRLGRFHFKPERHLISNGIRIKEYVVAEAPQTSPYIILCVGRFSREKDQMTLIRSMKYSKYADKIQLYFAGQGPTGRRLKRAADRIFDEGIVKYRPEFRFHSPKDLKKIAKKAYLNIHCATVEVEGLSCLEAIREGVVPVIASGRLSATSQFALDGRSIFPNKDSVTLAARIDWWIEHPEERLAMGQKYADSARQYDLNKSIAAVIEMYNTALSGK